MANDNVVGQEGWLMTWISRDNGAIATIHVIRQQVSWNNGEIVPGSRNVPVLISRLVGTGKFRSLENLAELSEANA